MRQPIAFAAIYLIWGSTYLGIRYAIETIPPLFMMGCRSLLAGIFLYAWARLRGEQKPTRSQWAVAFIAGTLLFAGGHGALAWCELRVPSGVASLLVASLPIWMTLLQPFGRRGEPIPSRAMAGVVLGFGGVVLLAEPGTLLAGEPVDPAGAAVLLLGTLSWAIGSVYSRGADRPESTLLGAGMNLIAGGSALFLASFLLGESPDPGAISPRSLLSLLYLVLFGSIIAFTAYMWLLRTTTPSRVATYAFVNPIVALMIGSWMGGEPMTPRVLSAALLMVTGVAITVSAPGSRRRKRAAGMPADPCLSKAASGEP